MDTSTLLGEEGVDEQLLAPTAGSNLASIFSDQTTKNFHDENDSLKYTPPKPPDLNIERKGSHQESLESSQTGNKTSKCLIAKAVHAYELVNGVYESRGRLGLALIQMFTPPHIRVVLFTSNKTTISSVTASQHFEISIQNNNYIAYYDDSSKNWSLLFANSADLFEVLETLRKYNVKINQPVEITTFSGPQQSDPMLSHDEQCIEDIQQERKKTEKKSLLNRIATVGQSVLPRPEHPPSRSNISDSSDETTQKEEKQFPIRHKTVKALSVARKFGNSKNLEESSDGSSHDFDRHSQITTVVPAASHTQSMPMCTYISGQLVPIAGNETQSSSLNVFLSETRASNSEVRINVNRISDKIDQVLEKLKLIEERKGGRMETVDGTPNFTIDIFQKLLREYEDKIRLKDCEINLLQEKILTAGNVELSYGNQTDNNITKNYEKIMSENCARKLELEKMQNTIVYKDDEIKKLKENMLNQEGKIELDMKSNDIINGLKIENSILSEKNKSLQCDLDEKTDKINNLSLAHDEVSKQLDEMKDENRRLLNELQGKAKILNPHDDHPESDAKIKFVMNNTYKALAGQFDNDTSYTSDKIRSIIASVIKQTTLQSLDFLQK